MSGPLPRPMGNFISRHSIRKVLIIKLTSLGDVVHALPAAAALKSSFPFLSLHWVVEDRCAPLLQGHPLLDSVVIYPRKEIQSLLRQRKWGQALNRFIRLRRSLRELKADLSLDLQGLAKSGLMALIAGARHRLGCFGLKEFSFLVSKSIPEGRDLHAVDRNLMVSTFLGAERTTPVFHIPIQEEAREWAEAFLRKNRVSEEAVLIGIQAGASLPQKCWPVKKLTDFLAQVSQLPGLRVLLFGDEEDRQKLRPFMDRLPPEVINTIGDLNLRQLMALIQKCRLFLGADTGPLHLAVGLGLPVIGLYGADDPGKTGPYGTAHRILYKRLSCSPCFKTPVCQGRFDCMEAIEVDEVLQAVLKSTGFSRSASPTLQNRSLPEAVVQGLE
ncbi:MAG: glycosyltransferase family 9 protein [Thermodesulfobacteriota bacterium]